MLYEALNDGRQRDGVRLIASLRVVSLAALFMALLVGSWALGLQEARAATWLVLLWLSVAIAWAMGQRLLERQRYRDGAATAAKASDALFALAACWALGGAEWFAFAALMIVVVTAGVFETPRRARVVYAICLVGFAALMSLQIAGVQAPAGLMPPALAASRLGVQVAAGVSMLALMAVAATILDRLARENRQRESQMRSASRRLQGLNTELTEKQFTLLCSQQDLTLSNERLKQKNEEVLKSRDVIRTLALAVEARDPYTEGHSTRVAGYAGALARELGMTREDQELLRNGCLLHDIGKINVPDSILRKVSSLEEEEYSLMRRHPEIGELICRPLVFARPFLDILRNHHERWDGRGYPDGLKAEEISVNARVAAVADAWDAMTSDRPYRKALPMPVAMQRLSDGAGTQWDPAIVEAYLRLVNRNLKSDDPSAIAEIAWSEPIY